jgi:hypothetical protein
MNHISYECISKIVQERDMAFIYVLSIYRLEISHVSNLLTIILFLAVFEKGRKK